MWARGLFILALSGLMVACANTSPPASVDNACAIFAERPDFYDAMADAEEKWGAPIQIQLAIMRQESSFDGKARPPRTWFLWVIPTGRKSSAYGYAQAKTDTWDWYRKDSGSGGADRDDIDDAADFVGWYIAKTHTMTGVSKWDAFGQYLAYHEGQGGYQRGTWRKKSWLQNVARKVERNAGNYGAQLQKCRKNLENERSGSWFWPF
ncbi:MAG: transglycosylase SLT domain-containing protein [Alphaproteobacteria bacterium]